MLTLTFNCDSAAELVQEFQKLNALTTMQPTGAIDASSIPLDALIEIVRQRLRDEGFKLEVIDQRDPSPAETPVETGQQPEATAPKTRKGKGAKNEPATPVDAPEDVDTLMGPKPKTPASTPTPDAPAPAADPEGDRQYVLDTLVTMRDDPKAKPKVDAFIAKMAKAHGTSKMFDIPTEHFPAIRGHMEKEFPDAPKPAA